MSLKASSNKALQWSSIRDTRPLLPNSIFLLVSSVPASNAADKASLSLQRPNSFLQLSMPLQTPAGTPLKVRTFHSALPVDLLACLPHAAILQMSMLLCITSMAYEYVHFSVYNSHHAGLYLNVSNFSGMKVIELCLEVTAAIPKPLQGAGIH
jgi:hypothetical protein